MALENTDNLQLAGSSDAVDSSALPKARTDLEITEQVYYGKPCYVLKDPAAMRYWRLQPPEYTIYSMLDGKHTMEDVLAALAQRFPAEQFDAQAVMNFLIMLRGGNLLQLPGQESSDYLLRRKRLLTRGIIARLRTEFLFFRIPLIDPDRFLNYLHNRVGPFIFNNFMKVVAWVTLAGALALLIANIDKLGNRQPLLSWINLLYMAPSFYLIKAVHEIGHGLTAKRFGCEVHEMGILFLVFFPFPYCDVSDSWMVTEKRKRMWITAAGIGIEIMLAALATYLWAFTESKTVINQFALNVMVLASINTLLFNGNPLLRYDGYYFVMDLLEIPNLKQKGTSYLWYLLQRYVLGVEHAQMPIDVRGREPAVLGYAVCSAIYRWFVMVAITTMVWRFLDPYGWGVVGGVMALGCLYNAFVGPLVKLVKFVSTQHHRLHIRAATATLLILVIAGAAYGVLAVPVEQEVIAQCVLRPESADSHQVYVTQAGFLQPGPDGAFVTDGQQVQAGDVLLQLQDDQIEHEVVSLAIQIDQLATEKRNALQQKNQGAAAQIQAKLDGISARHARLQANHAKLTITAPASGVLQILTPEPLARLRGRYIPLQTPVFAIYQPGRFEAVAAIGQRDIGLIEPNQPAQIKLWSLDSDTFESTVEQKPPKPAIRMSSAAFSTAFGGEVATMPAATPAEALEPAENTYEMVLPIACCDGRLRDGMVGRAKIILERQTLGRAAYRWLSQTLRQDIRI